ncbi:endodeoxyribonuclease-like protein [Canariomyces notabilis]|uniref:Endodeoxyribonuclease-like protein n=1 Tax=Canariomyces notabilis TaxID=2074819 RepID=A0AAN6QK15_9PEZI|nr:endodeoxyribonuclease-like protein [Canariomyces arenarius]
MAQPELDQPNGAVATGPATPELTNYTPRYIDIGINLADPIFRGRYHGKSRHPDDLKAVVGRAVEVGCTKLIVTGSSFKSSRDALKLAKEFPGTVFATAGIHPCSSSIFSPSHHKHHDESQSEGEDGDEHTPACDPDPSKPIPDGDGVDLVRSDQIIADLTDLIAKARSSSSSSPELVAFGEFGLDYDRLHYASKEVQLHSFAVQLALAASLKPQLPLFLHSRAAHADFVRLLKEAFGERLERLEKGGVVHSFTGTVEEMRELMELGLYIGVNGCSFKTAENCVVVKEIELSRLMLETDGPWCEVRPSHEGWKYLVEFEAKAKAAAAETVDEPEKPKQQQQQGKKKGQKKEPEVPDRYKVVKKEKWEEGAMVKGRNEPCTIERVARIVAGIKGVSVEEVCEAAWENTVKVFGLDS